MQHVPSLSPYERVFLGIAITVTAVWTIATLVHIVAPSRGIPQYANLTMMVVAGSFFGGSVITSRLRRRNGNNNSGQNNDDPYEGPGGYYRHDR